MGSPILGSQADIMKNPGGLSLLPQQVIPYVSQGLTSIPSSLFAGARQMFQDLPTIPTTEPEGMAKINVPRQAIGLIYGKAKHMFKPPKTNELAFIYSKNSEMDMIKYGETKKTQKQYLAEAASKSTAARSLSLGLSQSFEDFAGRNREKVMITLSAVNYILLQEEYDRLLGVKNFRDNTAWEDFTKACYTTHSLEKVMADIILDGITSEQSLSNPHRAIQDLPAANVGYMSMKKSLSTRLSGFQDCVPYSGLSNQGPGGNLHLLVRRSLFPLAVAQKGMYSRGAGTNPNEDPFVFQPNAGEPNIIMSKTEPSEDLLKRTQYIYAPQAYVVCWEGNGPLPIRYLQYESYDGQEHFDGQDTIFAKIIHTSPPGGEERSTYAGPPPPKYLTPIRNEGKYMQQHPMEVEVTLNKSKI